VSKIAKDQTDHALSSDLLERALFTFGRASLSLFNTKLAEGKARLDFSRPENRELWLAGYQYIKSLIMKGTYRTAFEWAKLLLSLDMEEDPYCMHLMLHHLALRAHEFKWLLEMGDFASGQDALPEGERIVRVASYTMFHNTPSLALAALQLKEGVRARELLSQSMQGLPWLFVRLFSDLNLDSPPSIWGHQPRTDAENLFTSLYVQQTKDLWNTTEGTALLMEIAHTISKTDIRSIPPVSNQEMNLDIVRFIYLDNTPALMALVPSHLLHRSDNSDSDPIPPNHSTYSYQLEESILEGRDNSQGIGGDFDDPMAALGRIIFRRRAEAGEDSDDQLEDIIRNGVRGPGVDSEDGNEVPHPPSIASRLLNYIFSSPTRRDHDMEDEEDEDEVTEEEYTDTDEMPDLVPFEHRFEHAERAAESEAETDDELPDLV